MPARRDHLPLIFSVLLHVIVLLLLVMSFEFSSPPPVLENVASNAKVISALAVKDPLTMATVKPIAPAKTQPPPVMPIAKPQAQLAPSPASSPPPPKVAKPIAVPTPSPAPLPPPAAIALKPAPKKITPPINNLIAQQLLADLHKQTVKTTQAAQQKALVKAMAKELKAQAAQALQQQMLQEEHRVSNARAQGEVNKYKALILQAIGKRWIVPPSVNKRIFAELMIRLAPDGMVLDVAVTKSSGDITLDRSARAAVYKASPLPVPSDDNAFEEFRQFALKMKPEDIIGNEQSEF